MTLISTSQRVSDNVRAAMARKRVNQMRLATVLGYSQAAVSRRLRGVVDFTVTELERIATELDVPVAELLAP